MAKPESYSVGLLPIAMAAGLLSGGLFRQTPTSEPAKPNPKAAERARDEVLPAGPWLSDLRPAMETIGDAMGLSLQRDAASRTAGVTGDELDSISSAKVTTAITTIRAGLMRRLASTAGGCEPIDGSLTKAEQTLNGYLLSDKDAKSSSRTLRTTVAEASVNELEDWRAFLALSQKVNGTDSTGGPARYSVDFIVATVPDYVDSNAGWVADQSLTAIQSAMSRSEHLLDRFRLIDWTRTDPRTDSPVATDSRLHERQPGVLIFRKEEQKDGIVRLQIVLLALETPTSGVHRPALRNAIRFIRAWQACASSKANLEVLGPTFSGSTLSMALTLGDPDDGFSDAFANIRVISGSATADENVGTFKRFAERVHFSAALQPTSETWRVMAGFLERMNRSWSGGENVAILKESNTAYGQTGPAKQDVPFGSASIFTFPLHVSQLRSDTPAAPTSTVTLLPAPAIPLNMRETTPAADQIPAFRPQLTSPVIEATVATILDTIRHERLTAVGIQATDDRDVLFLAREVKRAAPDVQLFFLGSHTLYLHQESIPYLRGTLVASTYPLSLSTQSGFEGAITRRREPFQSMAAQGLFNATLLLMNADSDALLDYCDSNAGPDEACRPRVSISVIGEDGFWPLPVAPATRRQNPQYVQAAGTRTVRESGRFRLPPFPTPAGIVVVVIVTFVLAQALMLVFIARRLRPGVLPRSFLDWPVLRVLAPTTTYAGAARLHQVALLMCFFVVALLFTWATAVVAPFAMSAWVFVPVGVVVAAGLVVVPAARLFNASQRAKRLPADWPEARRKPEALLLMFVLVPLSIGLGAFACYVGALVAQIGRPEDQALTLARVVGGGIVSPASATLCLLAALYTAMFAAMRRSSLVGYGYAWLEETSAAFSLINSCRRHTERCRAGAADDPHVLRRQPARLGDVLDMPVQNFPLPYVIVILLAAVIYLFSVARISTIEGAAFTWFVGGASVAVLMLGLVYLGQGLLIWNTARAHLKWLALSPIEGSFKSIAPLVPWDLSLTPPRLMEIMPVARRADRIVAELRALAGLTEKRARAGESPYGRRSTDQGRRAAEARLAVREGDLDSIGDLPSTASKVKSLEVEIRRRQHAPFMHSSTWLHLWKVSDAIVQLLQRNEWQRLAPQRRRETAALSGMPMVLALSRLPDAGPDAEGSAQMKVAVTLDAPPDADASVYREPNDERATLYRHCKEFVALQFAFVLRDIVARTLSMLFTAMLCLTFLTTAHLLYSFNGRSAMLTADLLAVAAAAVASIWILVSMERETVLSRLRNTTPGRLDVNWAFVQRVAVYGVLPLLAVIASLFPEIGNSLFGWLEPLRQLSSF